MNDDELNAFLDLPEAQNGNTGRGERWIVIPRWDGADGFQHYKDRDPVWIKNYRSLLRSDEYRQLSLTQRGALHGLWLEYAASNRQIRDSTLSITRLLGQRVTRATLNALNHAGFIHFSASKPLASRYHGASLEGETETEIEREHLSPRRSEDSKPSSQIKCNNCGHPVNPRSNCKNCGSTPRQAGSNPRKLRKPVICPDCQIGGGQHLADCPQAQPPPNGSVTLPSEHPAETP